MALSTDNPTSTITLTIPDTLRFWPWPRHINPHYAVCKKESTEWCDSFKAFSPKEQDAFNKCDFNLLASLVWPLLDRDGCRIGCDLMNLFFVIDGYTDLADPETARTQADIIMDALRNPHKPRPEDEWVGGKVAQQFWLNGIKSVNPGAQRRFVDTFQTYIDAVVLQAIDRNSNHIRDIDSYFEVRRETIGSLSSFAIMEMYMNLPDTVMNHPVIQRLTVLSNDMIIIGNDLYSYKRERDTGDDGHNLVTVVMHQFNLDPQGALNYISDLHDSLATQFLDEWKNIPVFGGPLDLEVRTYCDGLGNWPRGNECWSFESERYFGKEGLKVQKHRVIQVSK